MGQTAVKTAICLHGRATALETLRSPTALQQSHKVMQGTAKRSTELVFSVKAWLALQRNGCWPCMQPTFLSPLPNHEFQRLPEPFGCSSDGAASELKLGIVGGSLLTALGCAGIEAGTPAPVQTQTSSFSWDSTLYNRHHNHKSKYEIYIAKRNLCRGKYAANKHYWSRPPLQLAPQRKLRCRRWRMPLGFQVLRRK